MDDNDSLLKYYIQRSDDRFQHIDRKLDALMAFRWQLLGGAAVTSALVALLIDVVFVIYQGGK